MIIAVKFADLKIGQRFTVPDYGPVSGTKDHTLVKLDSRTYLDTATEEPVDVSEDGSLVDDDYVTLIDE